MRRLLVAFFVVAVALGAFVLPAGALASSSIPVVDFTPAAGATPTYGTGLTVSGVVTGSGGGIPTGTVTLKLNSNTLATATLDGTGHYQAAMPTLAPNSYQFDVSYSGDSSFAPTQTLGGVIIDKADTTVSVSGPTHLYLGQTVDYTINVHRVLAASGSPSAPGGNVWVHQPFATLGSVPVVGGVAHVAVPANTAPNTITFDYQGDGNYNPSTTSQGLTGPDKYGLKMTVLDLHGCTSDQLSPQNCVTPVPGYPMVLGAFFSLAPGTPNPPDILVPTGTVTFTDVTTNTVLGTSSISSDGLAAIFAAFSTPGGHAVRATYNGDSFFTGAVSNFLTVQVLNAGQVERYVNWVYLDLLNRDGDPGGVAFWTNQIESGTSRAATSWALVNSTEFRANTISDMYQQFLERSTDTAGLNYWVGQVGAGMTFEQFQSLLIGSDEYYNMASKGNGDNTTFVQSMYQDILNRPIDPTGQAYFVGLLNQGVPRARVVGAIVYSYEHLSTTVDGYYMRFLGRHSDPNGNQYWTGQLQHGARDELIIALIIGSDEYFFST